MKNDVYILHFRRIGGQHTEEVYTDRDAAFARRKAVKIRFAPLMYSYIVRRT